MAEIDPTGLNQRLENLHKLLKVAMKVELTTIPPYLHALFSIEDVGDGTANREAREAIRSVLVEEMLHLTLVANILSAVGGNSSLDEAKWVPAYPCQLFPKEAVGLTLCGKQVNSAHELEIHLRAFCCDQIKVFEEIEAQHPPTGGKDKLAIESIGQFYGLLQCELEDMTAKFGKQAIFTGDPAHQVGPEYYYAAGGTLVKVIDPLFDDPLKQAVEAIDLIIAEGEGLEYGSRIFDGQAKPGEPGEDIAHVFKFREILAGCRYRDGQNPTDRPQGMPFDVDWDAVWPAIRDPNPGDPSLPIEIAEAITAFDRRYSRLLREINLAFNGAPALLREAVHGMFELKYMGVALMRMPVGHGRTAAPAWRYVGEGE